MTIRKQPGGGYEVHVAITDPITGEKRSKRVRRKSLSLAAARRLEADMRMSLLASPRDRVPTLSEIVDEWLAYQATVNGPAELAKKRQLLRDHILPAFGHVRLDCIDSRMVDRYKSEKLAVLAPKTVANHIACIKRLLHQARDWGLLQTVPRIRQVRTTLTRFDFLTYDEADAYIAAAEPQWHAFMLLGIRTGLRLGELRGLTWSDVDLVNKQLHVRRAYTQTGWGAPKSGRGRTVDLCTEAASLLAAMHRQNPGLPSALVLPSPSGQPLDEKAAWKACARTAARAKIGRRITPHTLRHTFASHHAMAGTPLPVLQAWMGHASITTTMRYAHLCPSTGAAYAELPRARAALGNTADPAESNRSQPE